MHRQHLREEAVSASGDRSANGSRVVPKDLGIVVPTEVPTDTRTKAFGTLWSWPGPKGGYAGLRGEAVTR